MRTGLASTRPLWSNALRKAAWCGVGLLAVGMCSCFSTRPVSTGRSGTSSTSVLSAPKLPLSPLRKAKANANGVQEVPVPKSAAPVSVPPPAPAIEPASWQQPAEPPSGSAVVQTVSYPAEPRVPCETCPGSGAAGGVHYAGPGLLPGVPGAMPGAMLGPAGPVVVAQPLPSPAQFPDEYLCDGGDRQLPVHYVGVFRMGLDSEDAVAEYVDHNGAFHVTPTNRVCVYAPRFGAMRTISVPAVGAGVGQAIGADQLVTGVGVRARVGGVLSQQNDRAGGVRVRSRASGLVEETKLVGVTQRLALAANVELLGAYEDLNFLRTGQFIRAEEAKLKYGLQAAHVWTRTQSPVIQATLVGGQEIEVQAAPAEIVAVEDRRKPGILQIVKLADKVEAQPGDVITFTLRYDNLGDLPLSGIRIIDNLTPRLEYIEGSVVSDRAGDIETEPNGEGSLVLKFLLDEPLPGKTGGVITFKTRVR